MPVVFAQAPGERLDGEVVNLDDGKLTVRTVAGESVSVVLADGARVMIRVPGDLSNLDKGLYVGATAVPQPDGRLLASQINVFPESMRGTAEGHRPMAALLRGVHVVAYATRRPDGTLISERVSIGKNGSVPRSLA
jgi:hypothetical protein